MAMGKDFTVFASRAAKVTAVAVIAAGLFATAVEARPGGGGSVGSRGSRTYSSPPSTQTSPGATLPMQRSITQQQAPRTPGTIARPANLGTATAAAAPKRGFFGNFVLGGLLGAGLFGLLSGAGLFGGLASGGFAAVLGLILQMALIGGLAYLAMMVWRRSSMPAMAGASGPTLGGVDQMQRAGDGMSGLGAATGGATGALRLEADDFNAFEALLGKVQTGYGTGNRGQLAALVTPEMMSYFAEELDSNARQGLRNEVTGGRLLQGDLSEAWTESGSDYATVAMRYEITDAMVEVASGRVVSGSRSQPQSVTEVWTFRRPRGAAPVAWRLSAIQQVQ